MNHEQIRNHEQTISEAERALSLLEAATRRIKLFGDDWQKVTTDVIADFCRMVARTERERDEVRRAEIAGEAR